MWTAPWSTLRNRTRAITEASANGTVYVEQVIVNNADGVTGTTSDYINYGSGLVLTQNETITLNCSGTRTTPSPTFAANGSETGQSVTTTSADGLSPRRGLIRVARASTTSPPPRRR